MRRSHSLVLCAAAAVLSFSALGAPAVQEPAPAVQQEGPGPHNPMPMMFQGPGGPMMQPHHEPGFCHGGELFCASVLTDNPGDAAQKLNSILPATSGGHYRVRFSIEKIPDHPFPKGHNPDAGASGAAK